MLARANNVAHMPPNTSIPIFAASADATELFIASRRSAYDTHTTMAFHTAASIVK